MFWQCCDLGGVGSAPGILTAREILPHLLISLGKIKGKGQPRYFMFKLCSGNCS
jgi:hypothetical protein